MEKTLNNQIVKFMNYGSEEYIKDLLIRANPGLELQSLNAYAGVVYYPSEQFLTPTKEYQKATQFGDSFYVGHIEMLLPQINSPVNAGTSFTLLQFKLDGIVRQFLQISDGSAVSNGVAFADFVQRQYPKAGDIIPFNRSAFHTLSDINLIGASYVNGVDSITPFVPVSSVLGASTPAIEFEFAISGYRGIMQ